MKETRPNPPTTKVVPITEVLHGVEISDPYRWLEDQQSDESTRWIAAQNHYTRSILDDLLGRKELGQKIKALLEVGFVTAPVKHGEYYFYTKRTPGQNQPVLMVKQGDHERALIDPNQFEGDGTATLDWWHPSDDGTRLAYGISEGGDEWSTLFVLDVTTSQKLDDLIPYTRYSSVAWLPDNSGFYYTRYPTPGTVPPGEENYNRKVFFHKLGSEYQDDAMIFADKDPQAMLGVDLSPDGRYLLVSAAQGWVRNDLFLADLTEGSLNFERLTDDAIALYSVEMSEEAFYILTNRDAPRYRYMKATYDKPELANWQEIIAQGDHTIEQVKLAAGRLVVHSLQNATSRLHLYAMDGTLQAEVSLPDMGAISQVSGKFKSDEVFFDFTSFTQPITAYRYLPDTKQLEVFSAPKLPSELDLSQVVTKQIWYKSKDGMDISMFIVHGKKVTLDGNNPTILTGYGGFNISRTPAFFPGWLVWLEKGGVCALPNLRGGGEYGEEWHRAGMLGNKQNVFDDFAAAAEWLIANNYTNPKRLAIMGGSNGGLLVGAALTQRPDLFKAVHCAVPLLDMLRYQLFQIARLWIPEYGSSENAEQFQWLYAYSPYHHVQPEVQYPSVLFTTAEGDSRVDPLHACKMAALLQAVEAKHANPSEILLRVESRAGHGIGKPVFKLVEEQVDVWSFIAQQLGVHL